MSIKESAISKGGGGAKVGLGGQITPLSPLNAACFICVLIGEWAIWTDLAVLIWRLRRGTTAMTLRPPENFNLAVLNLAIFVKMCKTPN